MLKVLHITESHSENAGGVTTAVNQLAEKLTEKGCKTEIIASCSDPMQPSFDVKVVINKVHGIGKYWHWSNNLDSFIRARIDTFMPDVVHLHGMWMAPQWHGARLANKLGVKTVLSPHGMLEPWRLSYQARIHNIKKKIYWQLMAYPAFQKVSVIHAITPQDYKNLSQLFPGQRTELIPNAIDSNMVDKQLKGNTADILPIILFIGRIHPMKGIDLLVNAFIGARLDKKWKLVIAGPDEVPTYTQKMKDIIREDGVEDRVEFIGPIYDMDKWKWISRAWVVVAPSHSEVVGMVNLEAAACSTPTITTHETGLWDWNEGGGILISPKIEDLTEELKRVCSWNIVKRQKRGKKMRDFIGRRYSMEIVAQRWLSLYENLKTQTG